MTALRWARILRRLGHRVSLGERYEGGRFDLLVALHARKSAHAVEALRRAHPDAAVIVALTGTDVYRDIHRSRRARRTLEAADRLIVLQPLGVRELARQLRPRARVVYQSAEALRRAFAPSRRSFDVCVIGHLRREKDPLRAALAARQLPPASRIRVLQVGKAMNAEMARHARAEEARNPRYRWLGEKPRGEARAILGRSRAMVLSSWMEGGANVVSEALVASVPILASRIAGSIGLLGEDYAGFFPPGDTAALARLLHRVETDRRFAARLRAQCARRRFLTSPRLEERSWRQLLGEVTAAGRSVARSRKRLSSRS